MKEGPPEVLKSPTGQEIHLPEARDFSQERQLRNISQIIKIHFHYISFHNCHKKFEKGELHMKNKMCSSLKRFLALCLSVIIAFTNIQWQTFAEGVTDHYSIIWMAGKLMWRGVRYRQTMNGTQPGIRRGSPKLLSRTGSRMQKRIIRPGYAFCHRALETPTAIPRQKQASLRQTSLILNGAMTGIRAMTCMRSRTSLT